MAFISIPAPFRKDTLSSYVGELDLLRVTSALTLFLVIVFGFDHWVPKVFTNTLFIGVLIFPALLRHPTFWLLTALASTAALISDWYIADNHKYLLVYWIWVMWIAHLHPTKEEGEDILRWHARFFLIFIFLAAAGQKFFSPTYMSGEMFELKLFFDDRFRAFAHLVGIDRTIVDEAFRQSLILRSPLSEIDGNALTIPSTDWTRSVANLITLYDVYVQLAIGLLFIPRRYWTDLAGHILLLFFVFTTYLPAPVFGFGWTISMLGLITAFHRINSLIYWYFAAFLAVLVYQVPWREWVLS